MMKYSRILMAATRQLIQASVDLSKIYKPHLAIEKGGTLLGLNEPKKNRN